MKFDSAKKTGKPCKSIDWADDLNQQQKNRIQEGLADIKTGRTITSENLWAKYNRNA